MEAPGGALHQWAELRIVRAVPARYLYAGDNVGEDAGHNVRLEPVVRFHLLAVFCVVPAHEPTGGEARRVYRKLRLHRLERRCTLLNKALEDGRQFRQFQVVEDGIEVRHAGEIALGLRVGQIGHEAAAGNGRVDLETGGEDHLGEGQARAS